MRIIDGSKIGANCYLTLDQMYLILGSMNEPYTPMVKEIRAILRQGIAIAISPQTMKD